MIIPDETVQCVQIPGSAYAYARLHYLTFPRCTFEDDLLDYLKNGFVVSRPNLFAMAKVIVHPRNPSVAAWFIRYACGETRYLIDVLPFWLDWIVWCRNDDGRLRIYRTERLVAHAKRTPRGRMVTPNHKRISQAGSIPVAATSRKVAIT